MRERITEQFVLTAGEAGNTGYSSLRSGSVVLPCRLRIQHSHVFQQEYQARF